MNKEKTNDKELKLLEDFNKRTPNGFEKIYLLFAKSLNIFAASLYGFMSHQSQDIVEDTFVNLWITDQEFYSLKSLKSYLYVSVRNSYLNHKRHTDHVDKYRSTLNKEDFTYHILEAELFSVVDEAVAVLPKEYGEVIRKYVEGYKPAEIAKMLGKTEQSVYKIKHKSIHILRDKLTKNKTFLLFPFL